MALEGLPASGSAPKSGPPAAAANEQATGAAASPNAPANRFTNILADTAAASEANNSGEASSSAEEPSDSSTDDATADEIGFEDLSEFLTQVLIPGAATPAPPKPADAETTVEVDFTSGGGRANLSNLTQLMSNVTAAAGDLSAVESLAALTVKDSTSSDAGTASSTTSAAAPGGTNVDSLSSTDLSAAQSPSFSLLHSASAHHVTSSSNNAVNGELRSPVGTHVWNDELGAQLTWMAQQGKDTASLKLSPEHLGPIEVRISMQDGQASVWFGAANSDTRSALEQALPRLRELFSAQGLSLADSGVFREAPRQSQPSFANAPYGSAAPEEIGAVTSVTMRGTRLLDLYA